VLLFAAAATALYAQETGKRQTGYISTHDGERLFFQKVGDGKQVVILPGGLFLAPDLDVLAAKDRTLIYYDMRNRGRSSRVEDEGKITIQNDVRDLETVRKHFKAEKVSAVGYSYLGLMVVMYAIDHPQRVERLVQIGPVPRKWDTEYPKELGWRDPKPVVDPAATARLEQMRNEGVKQARPKEYCLEYWKYSRYRLVVDPNNAEQIDPATICEMENEWPVNFERHLTAHFQGSVQKLDVPVAAVKQVQVPVLTIHGRKDRNAPYAAGREWALTLPNARLITVPEAAHQVWLDAPWVLKSIDVFLTGAWPEQAQKITSMALNEKNVAN
jgi:proline iminopeptidase